MKEFNNKLNSMLEFSAEYLGDLKRYFSAKNKLLWSGSGKIGKNINIPNVGQYSSFEVSIFDDNTIQHIIANKQGNKIIGSNMTKNITADANILTSQYIELEIVDDNNIRVLTVNGMHHITGDSHGKISQLNGQISRIIGINPIPSKFGLGGGILRCLKSLFNLERGLSYVR